MTRRIITKYVIIWVSIAILLFLCSSVTLFIYLFLSAAFRFCVIVF